MVKFTISASYVLKIQNRMGVDLPYDITDIDPSILPGNVPAFSVIELILNNTETARTTRTAIIDPVVKLLTLPYSYGRPVFVEFSKNDDDATIQNIDLTEMPGFTMVENNDTVDHITEFGHHVKLYGETTSNICLDVWCDESAVIHRH